MKRKSLSRGFAFCLVILLLLSIIPLGTQAIEPTYSFSSLYKQSQYYDNFTELVLTGDQATDVISVATTQLGYHEGNSNLDFDGKNLSGTRNFVEYNRLVGMIDNYEGNGLSYGYEWCASFVNWTLRQTGVPIENSGSFVSCMGWVNYLIGNSMYKTSNTYVPKTGDFIFFKDSDSTRISTHIGFVRYVENGLVYTIEGNSGGAVNMRTYLLTDTYIVGYGTPKYLSNKQLALDFSKKTDIEGTYIASVDGANVRTEPSMNAQVFAYLSRGETILIDKIENGWGHCTYNNSDAWISMNVLYLISGKISTIKYDMNDGAGEILSCTIKYNEAHQISDIIPVRDGYNFIGWSTEMDSVTPEYIENGLYNKNEDIIFYAVWEEIIVEPSEIIPSTPPYENKDNSFNVDSELEDEPAVNGLDITISETEEEKGSKQHLNTGSDIIMALMLLTMPAVSFIAPFIRGKR